MCVNVKMDTSDTTAKLKLMLVTFYLVKMEQRVQRVLKIVLIKIVNMVHYLAVIVRVVLLEQLVKRLHCLNLVSNHAVGQINALNEAVYFIVCKDVVSLVQF